MKMDKQVGVCVCARAYLISCGVKNMNCLFSNDFALSSISLMLILLFNRSMNTSNSSKHLKGHSMASHNAIMNETVVNDLSPPDKDATFFVA